MKITLHPDERSKLRSHLAQVHYIGARLHGEIWDQAIAGARHALNELGLTAYSDEVLIKTLVPVLTLRVLEETQPSSGTRPEKPAREPVTRSAGAFPSRI